MIRLPILSLALAIVASALMLLPQTIHQVLYFDHSALAAGKLWPLVSGHWVHADVQHLLWNVAALLVLGSIIEVRSRKLLLYSLFVGMLSVDLLLYSPYSHIARYCGLSGLLNTLLGVALFIYWCETRSLAIIGIGVLCVGKIVVELFSGQAVITNISWPPYAVAHIAGLMGTPMAIGLYCARSRFGSLKYLGGLGQIQQEAAVEEFNNTIRTRNGYLVSSSVIGRKNSGKP